MKYTEWLSEKRKIFPYPCIDSSFCSPIEITLKRGKYLLEVWGASGGFSEGQEYAYTIGKGGFSRGILQLKSETKLLLNVGGSGKNGNPSISNLIYGGYNGGGNATGTLVGSGGGASDIRIGTNSLHRRIIVAGGGGGLEHTYSNGYAGAGGGENGIAGYEENFEQYSGGGGTQYGPGRHELSTGSPGFGFGGSTTESSTGAGGGGWYGGGASKADGGNGGGGSGYVFNITTKEYDPDFELDQNYFLTESYTIAGNQQFLSPFGDEETGHTGNGFIAITCLSLQNFCIHSIVFRISRLYFTQVYLLTLIS